MRPLWKYMFEGMSSMFDWVGKITPRSYEEIQDDIDAQLGKHGMKYHKTAAEALRSDWEKVGGDMKNAMKSLGVK